MEKCVLVCQRLALEQNMKIWFWQPQKYNNKVTGDFHFFGLGVHTYYFGNLDPHEKIQDLSTTPSGRKRENAQGQRTHFAQTNSFLDFPSVSTSSTFR
jgi:hypothetical protein